ncbi:MAG: histidine phosphatase family protein [Ilumatobacteraceae bacterium]
MARIYMVRHGRAAAGWDTDPDPGLDDLGRHQAQLMADILALRGPLALLSSPLRRCQETAAVLGDRWGSTATIEPMVAEIPSPEGVAMGARIEWLRQSMAGSWSALGDRYTTFRDGVADCLRAIDADTVIASHFVAINAAIGAATDNDAVVIRSLDNCSITIFDVTDGELTLVEGGHEADTLIR